MNICALSDFESYRLIPSSKLSLKCADEARMAVLTHFRASSEYTVIFTPNASGALKLVAESFPFASGSNLIIGADSHNSVSCIPISFVALTQATRTGPWHQRICNIQRRANNLRTLYFSRRL
jgi:hypothetical protein